MLNNTRLIETCPLCNSDRIVYDFVVNERVVCNCRDCSHLFINPQPINASFQNDYLFDVKAFRYFVNSAIHTEKRQKLRCLEIGVPLLDKNSYELINLTKSEISIHSQLTHEKKYDICVLNNVLDCVSNPGDLLQCVHKYLKENGLLFFYLPVLDSKLAEKLKQKWLGFLGDRLNFFSISTIQNILCKCVYEHIKITPADENGIFVSCQAKVLRHERVISIIVPVYNEENTVGILLSNIVDKHLESLKKEIIVIESNSTDSTRKIVEEFAREHSYVKLILEETPQGKGHAVRKGFDEATGDFIAIQDGDLEYDVNDYDQLVIPLVKYQEAFVLGSRHTGNWKIRDFGDKGKITATILNLGQIFFTSLINWGCGVKLKDPFTMYKLFRRECLYGLEFDANRFEIDWEIVIKLIRKGYIPVEIPINYHSRAFKDGKKVSMIRDPLIWLLSFIKYRYFYKTGIK